MTNQKVIVFTCNWNAYSGMETAGVERLSYPAICLPDQGDVPGSDQPRRHSQSL